MQVLSIKTYANLNFSTEQRLGRNGEFAENKRTLLASIKSFGEQKNLSEGFKLHARIVQRGWLHKEPGFSSALISMYCKCGALAEAQDVFDELSVRDIVSWTALLTGYAQHGLGYEVLSRFEKLQDEGIYPNEVTFACLLKACGSVQSIEKGVEIHDQIIKQGFLEKDVVLGNALLDMYCKCGRLLEAQHVFDSLPSHTVVSWTALIDGYAQHGLGDAALRLFENMQSAGFLPNVFTFSCILKVCGNVGLLNMGEEIHAEVRTKGMLERNCVLCNALVDMYVQCGALAKAQELFDELPIRNVICWNALITGYVQHGFGYEALNCYERMLDEGVIPNAVTYSSILTACGSTGSLQRGEEIDIEIREQGLLENDLVLGTALLDMYAKCGALTKARSVFDELPARNVVSWTALIDGYLQHGLAQMALNCYDKMQDEGVAPTAATFACALKACGSTSLIGKGEEIHDELKKQGLLEDNILLGNALVEMYAKSGHVAKAEDVFNKLPMKDVVSWNVLVAGYVQTGCVDRVLTYFTEMIEQNIVPDLVSYVILLTACSHAGLVKEGELFIDIMNTIYDLSPNVEQYACMVDLFSRAGHFDKALIVIKKVPSSDSLPLWLSLLGNCLKWQNVELGRQAFDHLVKMDKYCSAAYVCMGNLYAAVGMQAEAAEVERLRQKIEHQIPECHLLARNNVRFHPVQLTI